MHYIMLTNYEAPLRLCHRCFVHLRKLHPVTLNMPKTFPGSCRYNFSSGRRNASSQPKQAESDIRCNPVHIQMISEGIHRQVFKNAQVHNVEKSTLDKVTRHLKSFDLWDKKTEKLDKIDFKLPALFGENIDQHFRELAEHQTEPYLALIRDLLANSGAPRRPVKWRLQRGWVRYDGETEEPVPYPQEDGVVFDVEVLMSDGHYPTIATAVSSKAWYAWCSDRLFDDVTSQTARTPGLRDLIPMETQADHSAADNKWQPRLVIGHNVGFDRTFIKEQYYIQGTKLRFLDTMSMHIAVSGLTSLQRILYMANKTGSRRKEVLEHEQDRAKYGQTSSVKWLKESTLNNLNDVYQLYCKGPPLNKDLRKTFIEGNIQDVKEQFQELMDYCASDVDATLSVFKQLWPQFQERFPHPVTLAGMLEMGTAYLPTNRNWQRYIDQAQRTYDDLQQEMNQLLQRLADDACGLLEDHKYKEDVWLWDLDWTVKNLKYKKAKTTKKKNQKNGDVLEQMSAATKELAAKQPHMPGYPRWYADLCPKDSELDAGAAPGPSKITTQQRITPKLLSLTWDGYPLHFDGTHGWGYLVPKIYRDEAECEVEDELDRQETDDGDDAGDRRKEAKTASSKHDLPLKAVLSVVAETRPEWARRLLGYDASQQKADTLLNDIHKSTGEENGAEIWRKYREATEQKQQNGPSVEELQPKVTQSGVGPYPDVVPGCDFYRLPHKEHKTSQPK